MKHCLVLLMVLLAFSAQGQTVEIQGRVFEDRNGNTLLDQEEKGIPDVSVSDQVDTTVTDQDGYFSLTTGDDFPYVFISQPSGYVGAWYYQKSGEVNFPLQKSDSQKHFTFIHASDTHVESVMLPRMTRFRELADAKGAQFIIITGDLIKDALRANEALAREQFELYVAELKKFKTPVYSSVGNHDIFGIEREKSLVSAEHPLYGKKMYRHYLGPSYYSFNVGGVHFVAVDGVDYQNLWYYGGVDALQLKWLESDLEHLSSGTPVVTFNHIPFMSPGFSFRTFDTHAFYGPRLLDQNGTLQHRDIVYNFQQVKEVIGDRPYPLALAGHYHAAQEGSIAGYETTFAQTSAITGPDPFEYHGVVVRSGFTLYEVKDRKVVSSEFVPLDLP